MEHSPPPFFNRGPAPLVRLAFFASLSLALLVLDARFRYTEGLRSVLALAVYPLQSLATVPAALADRVSGYFASQSQLREENAALRAKLLAASQAAQRYEAAQAETGQLRRLVGAAERLPLKATAAEILYNGRDPYSRKIVIDKGSRSGVRAGSPVVDENGVVGQVTRAHVLSSEVTLLTDKQQAIPVQVVRNGLRAVAFGAGSNGMLELRFVAANAEIQNGDKLVTSGIDGTYPPGLPVATVARIERDAAYAFARIVCQPAAGVENGGYVLVLDGEAKRLPYPEEASQERDKRSGKTRKPRRKDADAAQ
ncbi:MAG: rod shape-determining protein MreC [Betaproteobacteria bacterium RBG_16_66_20]|nr:MAG: rod shape-determining protein MreC [Betaproteobacteria bacterium RBG_16_66_20]